MRLFMIAMSCQAEKMEILRCGDVKQLTQKATAQKMALGGISAVRGRKKLVLR